MADFFSDDFADIPDPPRFHEYVAGIMNESIEFQKPYALNDQTVTNKNKAMMKLHCMAKLWRKKNRKAGLTGVLPQVADGAGEPPEVVGPPSLDQAAAYLRQFWGQTFARKQTVGPAVRLLLDHVPTDLPEQSWEYDQNGVVDRLLHPKTFPGA